MNQKQYAESLVNQFRIVLMDADTECGNEILCTQIAIKNALICVEEIIKSNPRHPVQYSNTVGYFKEVKYELLKM
jgi:hypothetical protein